jgi:hypothetical protein
LSVLILTSEADHHSIQFQIKKRRLSTFLRSFGDEGKVNLKIKGGKISGRVEFREGLQSFSADLGTDGKWNGKLKKRLGKEIITFLVKKGKISHRRINLVSKLLPGNSDVLIFGGKSRASGESTSKDSQFQIKLRVSPDLELYGFIKHKSGMNYTKIELRPEGKWNAQGWVKLTGGKFLFSAETGKCEHRFEGRPRLV